MDPVDVAVGEDGRLYIADDYFVIWRVDPGGVVTVVAGTGEQGYDSTNPRDQCDMVPTGVAVGLDGTVYFSDTYNCVRFIDCDGLIQTAAGTAGAFSEGYSGDHGPAIEAALDRPLSVAVAFDGSLYIADTGNHAIRHVGPDMMITTVAGTGHPGFSGDGGPATSAQLGKPEGVAVAPDGTVYIADTNNHRVRRIGLDGTITTLAGTGAEGFSGDGGPATKAELRFPSSVTGGPDGSLYITDGGNYCVRRIARDHTITTVAGTGEKGCSDESGPATQTKLVPRGLAVGPDATLYIADGCGLIRAVAASKQLRTRRRPGR